MKKLILILLVFTFFKANSQTVFISPSIGYFNKTSYYGLEAGISYTKTWISTAYNYIPASKENLISLNVYNKINEDKKLSLYLNNSFKMNLNTSDIFYESGASILYEISPTLYPQFTASIPIVKNTFLSYTFSLMINLKK